MEDLVLVKYFSINIFYHHYQSVQFSHNCVWLFVTPWTASHQASLSITNPWSLLRLLSIESVMPSNHLVLCHPLLFPPSIFPGSFFNKSVLHFRWPKFWSFSFSISPSNQYSGLIFFRMDWLDLLAEESSSTPRFKSINSSMLSFLYSPTFISMHDWKSDSFDKTNFCGQSNVCAF